MNPSEPTYLLDTGTARVLLRANAPASLRARIRAAKFGSLWMSALTEGQLRAHALHPDTCTFPTQALDLLLRNVPTVPFDRAAAIAYSVLPELAAAEPLDTVDRLVVAHAISLDATLITVAAHYQTIEGLRTANWTLD
jgi:tRNA(fMet)-specific endonuclease VapC